MARVAYGDSKKQFVQDWQNNDFMAKNGGGCVCKSDRRLTKRKEKLGVQRAIRKLREKRHYLFNASDNYWYDTKPGLKRTMETCKERITGANNLLSSFDFLAVRQGVEGGSEISGNHPHSPRLRRADKEHKGHKEFGAIWLIPR